MRKQHLSPFLLIALLLLANTGLVASLRAQDCAGAFYQMKPGTTFTLTTYNPKDKLLSSATHVFKSVDKTANGLKAQVEMEVADDKNKAIGKNSYDLTCKGGIISLNMRDMAFGGTPMPNAANMEIEMSGDELNLPPTLKAGQTLDGASFNITAKMGQVKFMDRSFTIKERKVEGVETIETPAGKFECYKVSYLTDTEGMMGKPKTLKTITWYAKGPGLVRNESYDDKGKMTGYTVLTKFSK